MVKKIIDALKQQASVEKAKVLASFFKTGKGQYGEGDMFLGVTVPDNRKIAKQFSYASFDNLDELLQSEWHEVRLCALLILVDRCKEKRITTDERKACYDFYIQHAVCCNSWDLVDLTSPIVVGEYLLNSSDKTVLYTLAHSNNLWQQRIAVVATLPLIRAGQFNDTFSLVKLLMGHTHDLIHKAMGWMLREVGKKELNALNEFLEVYASRLPRTTLRYAIEKHDKAQRLYYLSL